MGSHSGARPVFQCFSHPGLYRTRLVLQRAPGAAADGYLWRWFGQRPHALSWLDSLPPDTVYAVALDLDLAGIWSAVHAEAQQSGLDPLRQALAELSNGVEQVTGSSLEQHLASLGGEIGVALILHPTRTFSIPLPDGGTIDLPEPALAVALKVKDSRLFDFLDQALAEIPESAGGGILNLELVQPPEGSRGDTETGRWRTIPMPAGAPFPLDPLVARTGDTLWITSTRTLLGRLLAVQAGQSPGLKASAEFHRLARGLPVEGNSWAFVGQRFGETLGRVQNAMIRQAAGGQIAFAPYEAIEKLMGLAKNQSSFGVGWQDAEGAQSVTQGTQEPASVLMGAAVVAPVAIMAGMTLPALARAKSKAQEISCVNNLKQIGLALRIYATDHEDVFPPDLESIREELALPAVLVCPSQPGADRLRGLSWSEFDFDQCVYEYLEPGLKAGEKAFDTPVVRCKIHGSVVRADGSVQRQ